MSLGVHRHYFLKSTIGNEDHTCNSGLNCNLMLFPSSTDAIPDWGLVFGTLANYCYLHEGTLAGYPNTGRPRSQTCSPILTWLPQADWSHPWKHDIAAMFFFPLCGRQLEIVLMFCESHMCKPLVFRLLWHSYMETQSPAKLRFNYWIVLISCECNVAIFLKAAAN